MKLHTKPWGEGVPYGCRDQKVKGQGHNVVINEYSFCCIVALSSHLKSWYFTHRLPMSWGCALLMPGSKGQMSRSKCIDYWKWFWAHNCFPFTSTIIKLLAHIPYESRICLNDIGVKKLGSLNWLSRGGGGGGVFVPLGQPHSSFIIPILLYLFIYCKYNLHWNIKSLRQ